MLYGFVKIIARIALHFYCRDIKINNAALLQASGPLLLAANHPNSFLDAILLCTLFKQPVYSLARGDAFKKPWTAKLLTALKMLPVYRVSEGVENMEENYTTFELCKNIFRQNGIVLIFSEGQCVNEWHLRPLKKGTARLAVSSWQEGIPLKALPVGINYQSFGKFGKQVHLNFGTPVTYDEISVKEGQGRLLQAFNNILFTQLAPLVYEIEPGDTKKLKATFHLPQPGWKKVLLWLPSLVGRCLHAPLYCYLERRVKAKRASSDHFDSLVVSLLLFSYPFYILFFTLGALLLPGHWWWLPIVVFPFTAWSHLQLKNQFS